MQIPLSKESLDELTNIGFICDEINKDFDFHNCKLHSDVLCNYSRDNIVVTFLQGFCEKYTMSDSITSLHIKIFNHKGRNDIFRVRYYSGNFIVYFGGKKLHFYARTEKITESYFSEKTQEVLEYLSMLPLDVLKFFFGHYVNVPCGVKSAMIRN